MKTIISSLLLLLLLQSLCMADNNKDKPYRYEGEASADLIIFGLGGTTTHGARFNGPDLFIGATAGYYRSFGDDIILVAAQPKWYFSDSRKLDLYISCDIGAAYMCSSSYRPSSPSGNYHLETMNAAFVPRIGMGIKTGSRILVDLSLKYMMLLNTTYKEYSRNILSQYPAFSIGIRF